MSRRAILAIHLFGRLLVVLAIAGLLAPAMGHVAGVAAVPPAAAHHQGYAAVAAQPSAGAPAHAPAQHDKAACAFCVPVPEGPRTAAPPSDAPETLVPAPQISGRAPSPEPHPPKPPLIA